MRVAEVSILGDDNATLVVRNVSELLVGCAVAVGELGGVQRVVTGGAQCRASRSGNCASIRNLTRR